MNDPNICYLVTSWFLKNHTWGSMAFHGHWLRPPPADGSQAKWKTFCHGGQTYFEKTCPLSGTAFALFGFRVYDGFAWFQLKGLWFCWAVLLHVFGPKAWAILQALLHIETGLGRYLPTADIVANTAWESHLAEQELSQDCTKMHFWKFSTILGICKDFTFHVLCTRPHIFFSKNMLNFGWSESQVEALQL